jgi:hypothetical protein
MTVAELIEKLQGLNPETEVRMANQPRWAFEYDIESAVVVEIENERTGEINEVVYLEEGFAIGYLPSEAIQALSW